MKLIEIIEETVKSKYNTDKPVINGKVIKQYVDQHIPKTLFSQHLNTYGEKKMLAPNTRNFIDAEQYQQASFTEFMNLAKNRYIPDFKRIEKNNHRLIVIGYGGFMSNMFYFINEIMKKFNVNSYTIPFDWTVYENDTFSLMNNVRTFQDTSKIYYNSEEKLNKLELIESITNNIQYPSKKERIFNKDTLDYWETYNNSNSPFLYLGSPDFETRQLLENKNFLFFGNSNSDFVIHKSPVIDGAMTRETYGKLNVIEFWVGILEATFEFLKILENNTSEELYNMEHNIELWSTTINKKEEIEL